jgi:hypothetical protein
VAGHVEVEVAAGVAVVYPMLDRTRLPMELLLSPPMIFSLLTVAHSLAISSSMAVVGS